MSPSPSTQFSLEFLERQTRKDEGARVETTETGCHRLQFPSRVQRHSCLSHKYLESAEWQAEVEFSRCFLCQQLCLSQIGLLFSQSLLQCLPFRPCFVPLSFSFHASFLPPPHLEFVHLSRRKSRWRHQNVKGVPVQYGWVNKATKAIFHCI